jgi:hypothetical protein
LPICGPPSSTGPSSPAPLSPLPLLLPLPLLELPLLLPLPLLELPLLLPLLELPLLLPLPELPLLPVPFPEELEPHAVATATAIALPRTAITASWIDRMDILRLKNPRAHTIAGRVAREAAPAWP